MLAKVEDRDKVLPRVAAEVVLAKAKEGAWAEELVKAWAEIVSAQIVDIKNLIREVLSVSI